MSNHESPMLKSARQMSEARAYGFNSSGTMAGQVGADAAQRERNAQRVSASPTRNSGGYSGGGGSGGGINGVSDFFAVLFGGAIWIAGLWFLGPLVLPWVWAGIAAGMSALANWAAARAVEAGLTLLGWAPDIGGYLAVVALCIVALAIVVSFTRTTILIASGLWLAAGGIMAFLLTRWHDPATGISWFGTVAWSFPVYAPLINLLTLPLTYDWFRQNNFNENLSRAFSYSAVLLAVFSMGMVCLGFGIGRPDIIISGLIYVVGGSALLAGLMITGALTAHFAWAARDD
jgi:hypothetical protein